MKYMICLTIQGWQKCGGKVAERNISYYKSNSYGESKNLRAMAPQFHHFCYNDHPWEDF